MSFKHVQIGFAGHNRPEDLDDPQAAQRSLAQAFRLLRAAGVDGATLITGVAEGADQLAIDAWNEVGLGPIHGVHPFLQDPEPDFKAVHGRKDTWLDGESFAQTGRSAHMAQTRWLVESADLLLVVWGGDRARGPGGTADAVSLALKRGVAVLWIKSPDYDGLTFITPPDLDDGFSFNELLHQIERKPDTVTATAAPDQIAAYFQERGFDRRHIGEMEEEKTGLNPLALLDGLAHLTLWRAYALFHRLVGGSRRPADPTPAVPQDLSEQSGFQTLSSAYERADRLANRLSAVHRSQQLFLLFGAITATVVGSSPAIWEEQHLFAVAVELSLAIVALLVWSNGARSRRHERWSHARRLAEQLRLERAAWALGLTAIDPQGSDKLGPAACEARACRRQAGLAVGRFDFDRVSRWGDWAIGELITSQANYHRDHSHRNLQIAHRMHMMENLVFLIFVAILVSFVLGSGVAPLFGLSLPKWVGGALIMTSAVVPAIGAAVLALEANLAFSERGRESQFLAARLDRIREKLPRPAQLLDYQRAASAAVRLHNTEQDLWAENASHRPLIKGA